MPTRPARVCSKPGCRGLVRDGACSVCGPVPQRPSGWQRANGSRQSRGYDQAWLELRQAFLAAERARCGGVLVCGICGEPITKGPVHVDHKEPFQGLDDPRRLDVTNLRACHARCHMRRTAQDQA